MAAYAIRVTERDINRPDLNKENYAHFSSAQFITFSKIYLKDNILSSTMQQGLNISGINSFMESIPDYLIDFSSEMTMKLLHNYIVSNLKYGFGVAVTEGIEDIIYSSIVRLSKVDPRINLTR